MKKKALWLTLVLVLVLALIPITAMASEPQQTGNITHETIPFQVNPLYKDLYGDTVVHKAPNPVQSEENQMPVLNATYVTEAKAAQQIREKMKSRSESFTIYVNSEDDAYRRLTENLLAQAMAHTGDPEEGDYLMWHYAGWGAEISSEVVAKGYNYTIAFSMSYYTTAAQEKELDTAVSNLLKNLNVSKKSDYQKVKAVYDYICANITYDYENLEDPEYMLKHTAYAALVDKTAVCQGYASLMYRLLLELDVDTRVIAGEAIEGGAHGWNITKLGDVYYNLDSTWDAGMSEYSYFLKNSEGFWDHLRYLEYATTQFHTDYPMSATDYVDGVAGKPEYVFVWGSCGDDVYWEIDRDKLLTIYGTGATYDFEKDGYGELDTMSPWLSWKDGFRKVVIEEGVTALGMNAFYEMDNVTDVVMPSTLTTLGECAFGRISGLTKIKLPEGLQTIGAECFEACRGVTSVTFPSTLKKINSGAFSECDALKEIKLPEGLETIGIYAFDRCDALTKVVIPSSVTALSGFSDCANLVSVQLNNSGTISSEAFSKCPKLTKVTIPDTVTQIRNQAFAECTGLTEIIIPESVISLETKAFFRCRGIKTAYLYNSGSVGNGAFRECDSLSKVVLSEGITKLESYAFADCIALQELTIPSTVTEIMNHAFSDSSLKTITFIGDAPAIKGYSFDDIIATVYYPDNNATWETEEMAEWMAHFTNIAWVSYHNHDYTGVKPAFNEETKTHSWACTGCGEPKTESCTAESVVLKEATMDSRGVREYTCTVCGGSWQESFLYRISGDNRAATALAAADKLMEILGADSFDTIIIASGDNFADALAGSYLAAKKDAPILLYTKNSENKLADYVSENMNDSGMVYILGGVNSVPQKMEDALADRGFEAKRLAGDNRFATNLAILEEAGVDGEEILVCTAYNFADSLSASAVGQPILLVNKTLTGSQKEFISGSTSFAIIGGVNSVTEEVEADLKACGTVVRVSGESREETSAALAKRYFAAPEYAVLAYSRNFPDGLCGGPLAFALGAPLLLTNSGAESAAAEYVAEKSITRGIVLGGPNSISDKTVNIIFTAE